MDNSPNHGVAGLLYRLVSLGVTDELDDDEAMNRRIIMGATLFQAFVAPTWVILYLAFDEHMAATAAAGVTVGGAVSLVGLWRTGRWTWFRRANYFWWFVTAFALMTSLGGYALGSAVITWSVFAPLMAFLEGRFREAIGWSVVFVLTAAVAGAIQPLLRETNNLPDGVRTSLFVLDVVMPSILIFMLVTYFVRQKDRAIVVMRRNRELESAYLAQELNLRQNEKLATVGRLSAGLAHELNNPTAAAQQATQQLTSLFGNETRLRAGVEALDLRADERDALSPYADRVLNSVQQPDFLDPLERSDRESQIQQVLDGIGVEDAWEVAPAMVDLGIGVDDLEELKTKVRGDRLAGLAADVAIHFQRQRLLSGLDESMTRIIQLVTALKSYTFLDQAPRQVIDVHDGLDSTLVMLQNRLKKGIVVTRSYGDDVPLIEAFGGELNQVWTNVIDNAIHAMQGHGSIVIATRRSGDSVVVKITDDGPGISSEILGSIFDPFVTTKPPGEGTGLGLNITHNIVTQKHGGAIDVESEPGKTTFVIRLPISSPADPVGSVEVDEP